MSAEWSPTAFYRYGDVVMYEGVDYALTVPGNERAVVGIPPANNASWVTPPPPPASTVQQSADSLLFENIRATSAVIKLVFSTPQSNPTATSITINSPTGFSYNVNYALGLIYVYGLIENTTYGPWEISFGTNIRSYAETFITDAAPPPPITNVLVTNVTNNSCRVDWLGGGRLDEGEYDFGFNGVSIVPTTITHILGIGSATFVGSLEPGTSYSLVVGFYDNFENVVEAPPVFFTTANPPPVPPPITPITNITFTRVSDYRFQINWNGGTDFPNLYTFSTEPAYSPTLVGRNYAQFDDLEPDTRYMVEFIASDGVITERGGPAFVTTTNSAPPVSEIYNVVATLITSDSVTLSWIGGTQNASDFSFTLNGNPATATFSSVGPDEWIATLSGLMYYTPYTVVIFCNNGIETVQSNPYNVFTLLPAGGNLVITSLSVDNIDDTFFTVTVTATLRGQSDLPVNASFFLNQVRSFPAGVTSGTVPFTGTGTFTFIGLRPNSIYSFQVICQSGGNADSASTVIVTTAPGVPLSPITNEEINNITSSGFGVTWSGGDGVLADYSFTLNGNNAVPSAKTTSSATFVGLSPSTQYTLVITCDNGDSNVQSSPLSVTTLAGPPVPPPSNLQSLYVIDFLLYDGAQWVICQQGPSDIGTWYLTGPNAGQIQNNTGQNVITYLKGLQAQGCKIILSFGGGGLTPQILATMFASPASTARSIAYALLSNSTGSNPLGFAKSGTPWENFEFDGFDMDVEANTPNPADQLSVFQNLRALVPNKLLVAAPQAPNLVPSNAFGGNGNGNWYPFPRAFPSDTLANYNTEPGPDAWMYPPNMTTIGLDYIFVQFYNQGPSWYPGTPGTSFVPALAMWGYLCFLSTTCKVVLGFSTNDGNPIWNQSTDAGAVNDAITQANDLIQTKAGSPVTPSMWLAGWGAWNSPSANDVAANIFSPSGGIPNLPGTATMLYLADQAVTPNPGWVGPVPNTR